jgi:hypothetical protein
MSMAQIGRKLRINFREAYMNGDDHGPEESIVRVETVIITNT